MHSIIVIIIAGICLLVEASSLSIPFSVLAVGLALGVLVIGLPHGGLDHKLGLRLLKNFPRPFALSVFFASYLLVAAIVIAGWFISPLMTIVGFFCLSAWHFGLEEHHREYRSMMDRLGGFARGGMVIWIPACFQAEQVTNLLKMILPGDDVSVAAQVVSVIQFSAPIFVVLLTIDTILSDRSSAIAMAGLSINNLHRLRVIVFALLFAIADPLISFAVYFCSWHSVIGLFHLRDEFQFSNRELVMKLLPLSLLAVALFVIGFAVSSSTQLIGTAIVQTIFMGLSAVAIPHLILHIVSDSLRISGEGAVS